MESSRGVAGLSRRAMSVLGPVLALNIPRLAAALTYYTVLSLLPALLVVVALLGVVGLSPNACRTSWTPSANSARSGPWTSSTAPWTA